MSECGDTATTTVVGVDADVPASEMDDCVRVYKHMKTRVQMSRFFVTAVVFVNLCWALGMAVGTTLPMELALIAVLVMCAALYPLSSQTTMGYEQRNVECGRLVVSVFFAGCTLGCLFHSSGKVLLLAVGYAFMTAALVQFMWGIDAPPLRSFVFSCAVCLPFFVILPPLLFGWSWSRLVLSLLISAWAVFVPRHVRWVFMRKTPATFFQNLCVAVFRPILLLTAPDHYGRM